MQWHIAAENATDNVYVAVNLEGLKYGSGRPIRRFLHREKSRPLIPALCRRSTRAAELYAHVNREGWPGRNVGVPVYGLEAEFDDPADSRAHERDERLPIKSFYDAVEFWHDLVPMLAGK